MKLDKYQKHEFSAVFEYDGMVYDVEDIDYIKGENRHINSASLDPNDEPYLNNYTIVSIRPSLECQKFGINIDAIFADSYDFECALINHIESGDSDYVL